MFGWPQAMFVCNLKQGGPGHNVRLRARRRRFVCNLTQGTHQNVQKIFPEVNLGTSLPVSLC